MKTTSLFLFLFFISSSCFAYIVIPNKKLKPHIISQIEKYESLRDQADEEWQKNHYAYELELLKLVLAASNKDMAAITEMMPGNFREAIRKKSPLGHESPFDDRGDRLELFLPPDLVEEFKIYYENTFAGKQFSMVDVILGIDFSIEEKSQLLRALLDHVYFGRITLLQDTLPVYLGEPNSVRIEAISVLLDIVLEDRSIDVFIKDFLDPDPVQKSWARSNPPDVIQGRFEAADLLVGYLAKDVELNPRTAASKGSKTSLDRICDLAREQNETYFMDRVVMALPASLTGSCLP